MGLFDRALATIKDNKERVKNGLVNSIPTNLPRFNEEFCIEQKQMYIVTGNTKSGKCFAKGTKVLLYNGFSKNVEDITIEDILIGPDGLPRTVLGTNCGIEELFIIKNRNYNDLIVNKSHILHLEKIEYNPLSFSYVNISVENYLQLPDSQKQKYRIRSTGIDYFNRVENNPIDPYFYGLWIGDGDSDGPGITNVDKEIIDYIYNFAHNNGLKVRPVGNINENYKKKIRFALSTDVTIVAYDENEILYYPNAISAAEGDVNYCARIERAIRTGKIQNGYYWGRENKKGEFRKLFKEVTGLSKTHINRDYLLGSLECRKHLLAGIIDSDGYHNKKRNVTEITTKHYSLAEDILFLIRSLGMLARIYVKHNKIHNKDYYTVSFVQNRELPILLSRKQGRTETARNLGRFTIEYHGIGEYFGFEVSNDNLFLLNDFMVVHNSKITDHLFVHNPLQFAYQHPDKVRVKIFYFTLEMTDIEKSLEIMSNILWNTSDYRIRATPKDLRSVNLNKELPDKVIDLLESKDFKSIYEFYENHVTYISDIRNPYGIFLFMQDYALANGIMHKKKVKYENKINGQIIEKEIDDYYEPYDPDEYVIIIVDHMSLITPEKGEDLRESMVKLSSKYFVELRNKYKYIPVEVIQQKMDQESNENMKLNKLRPTLDGIGDSRKCGQDANVVLGIFSPYRHGIESYMGYDIKQMKDSCRFLELIVGREGGGGNTCPLLFDGGVNHFSELPLPNDVLGLAKTKKLLERMQSPKIEQAVNYI